MHEKSSVQCQKKEVQTRQALALISSVQHNYSTCICIYMYMYMAKSLQLIRCTCTYNCYVIHTRLFLVSRFPSWDSSRAGQSGDPGTDSEGFWLCRSIICGLWPHSQGNWEVRNLTCDGGCGCCISGKRRREGGVEGLREREVERRVDEEGGREGGRKDGRK